MLRLCRVNIERSTEILERLDNYKGEVVKNLDPERIILFGSFARGDVSEGSDVDLIVVADWKEGFLDRIKVLLELNRFGIPLEPIGYTWGEFRRLIEEGNPFIAEVLSEGREIYRKS